MGSSISCLFRKSEPKPHIGILGLNNAGKTTLLDKLRSRKFVRPNLKGGWNFGDMEITIWNINGSHPKVRLFKQHCNTDTRAIIFVVDCADQELLPKAAYHLHRFLSCPELADAAVLVYANKQDVSGAVDAKYLAAFLELRTIKQKWAIQECCAFRDMGLSKGLKKLTEMLECSESLDDLRVESELSPDPPMDAKWIDPTDRFFIWYGQ